VGRKATGPKGWDSRVAEVEPGTNRTGLLRLPRIGNPVFVSEEIDMSIKRIVVLKDQSGFVLVVSLMMLVVITLITLAATFTSVVEVKLGGNKRASTDAFYAAESGVQVTVANIENFNSSGYVDNNYDPFSDPSNPNPTGAKVTIRFDPTQQGSPRGLGLSATGNFEFSHFLIESTGQDQTESGPIRSTCTVQEKVVRLLPTQQGGH